jgi:hypothetical protein
MEGWRLLTVCKQWRKAAKGNLEEIAEHEEYDHCPQLGREIKKGKKEVPGLDKVLLIEGRNKPALAGVSGEVSRTCPGAYAGNARERAYSGLRCVTSVIR